MEDARLTAEQVRSFCEMMHKALLEIRTLAGVGLSQQAAALADAFHDLPLTLFDRSFDWKRTRSFISGYQRKFPDRVINNVVSGSYYDYDSMLNDIEKRCVDIER